jgi:hypothetical protein
MRSDVCTVVLDGIRPFCPMLTLRGRGGGKELAVIELMH